MRNNNNKRRPYNKNNGRNKKNLNPLRSQFDSNGPIGRIRGTAQQIADKYISASREAKVAGDRVREEELLQLSEHYLRMIVEWRIENPALEKEKNDKSDNKSEEVSENIEQEKIEQIIDNDNSEKVEQPSNDNPEQPDTKQAV
ncbi:MAG: DUF4167 domain-containing protein [Alphaproteobacteria bacterium]